MSTPKSGMKRGTTLTIWKDDEDPLGSWRTRVAAAALASGAELLPDGFLHVAMPESDPVQGAEPPPLRHRVTWQWYAKTIRFDPIPQAEEITLAELERRFADLDWCAANPNHPIAYMRAFLLKSQGLRESMDTHGPCVEIRREGALAVVPANATAEEIEELFQQLAEQRKG